MIQYWNYRKHSLPLLSVAFEIVSRVLSVSLEVSVSVSSVSVVDVSLVVTSHVFDKYNIEI